MTLQAFTCPSCRGSGGNIVRLANRDSLSWCLLLSTYTKGYRVKWIDCNRCKGKRYVSVVVEELEKA